MNCNDLRELLNAYVDGELDSSGSLSVERHLQQCSACLAGAESLRALNASIREGGLRFEAPGRLKRQLRTSSPEPSPKYRISPFGWRWAAALGTALALVVVGWMGVTRWQSAAARTALVNDIVSSHVRSMMVGHITDVASSDSHTVKPWFSGKLDFSPPAKDLTPQGFRLVGGRLDYLDDRPVAALVYQRSQHLINLFVWPSDHPPAAGEDRLTRQGYNMIHWTASGMSYWLISELNPSELEECARLLRE